MATIQTINIGTSANDNTGDTLRNAFDKTNQNNTALNNDLATKAPLASPTFTGTLTAVNDASFNGVRIGKGAGNIASNSVLGFGAFIFNTIGVNNSAFGYGALNSAVEANANTAVGLNSLLLNQFGDNNTAVGGGSLQACIAYNNTAIGYGSGSSITNQFNTTSVGNQATSIASNQVTLGNSSVNSLRCNVQVITSLSDSRDKTEIKEISEGLDFVSKLKPVTFTWNQRDGGRVGIKSAGFIAQDLLELQNDSLIGENLDLVSNDNPDQLEARYANLMPIMIKAIQELKAEIELLKSK